MMHDRITSLIKKITSVGFDIHTDYPSNCQVESADNGVMTLSYYDEREDGTFVFPPTYVDGDFAAVMHAALVYEPWSLDIDGLTEQEAFDVVTAPDHLMALQELAQRSELGDQMFRVNGVGFAMHDDELLSSTFPTSNAKLIDPD